MKMFFLIPLVFIICVFIFLGWASYPWSLKESSKTVKVIELRTQTPSKELPESPSVLKILTFNLGFLFGKGSEGPSYFHQDKKFYQNKINDLVFQLKKWDADVVCLQEIDFNSARSHGMNQARELGEKAGYPYLAEAVSWNAHYIPFPYFPLKNHFGPMSSGGAILSRYPIVDHSYILLNKPGSNPWWYNLFYLHRYLQKVSILVGDKTFSLLNLHLEAFDKEDRLLQIQKINKLHEKTPFDFIAGDFNMLATSASKKSKFFNDDDYENDPSFEEMKKSTLQEVIPEEIYSKEESLYFTFPAWAPDRRLDYIWYKKELKMVKAEVKTSEVSDHLPLMAIFQIDGPRFNPYSQ
jgi:endonuclease/exonuclease/phosphatase family metal-dependent hydrolase